jgi:hypothetical protein
MKRELKTWYRAASTCHHIQENKRTKIQGIFSEGNPPGARPGRPGGKKSRPAVVVIEGLFLSGFLDRSFAIMNIKQEVRVTVGKGTGWRCGKNV